MNKVTIIGAGSVGSTIAYTLSVMGLATEIVMIDINSDKALGEALDIRQGSPFCGPCKVYAGSYRDAKDSNIVILTSGLARKPGQTRLELAQVNVDTTKSIIPNIVRYAPDAIYILVSNPVDILTYTFCKLSGLPVEHIIGSGTILDTARLRSRLSEYYKINQTNVHAYVMGEHGDSSFIPWSLANISNVPIAEFQNSVLGMDTHYPELDYSEVENYVRKSGARVIARKGATFYAVSVSVCHIVQCLLTGVDTTLTVSTMMNGEYGLEDVALSVLTVIGQNGATGKILLPLNEFERKQLGKSSNALKEVIRNLTI